MLSLHKGIICIFLGMVSLHAFAVVTPKVYSQAQEIVIPGYTPPAPSTPATFDPSTNSSPPSTFAPDTFPPPSANSTPPSNPSPNMAPASPTSSSTTPPSLAPTVPLSPEMMRKSCEKYVEAGVPFEAIRDNFKKNFDETDTGNIYQWTREGGPNVEITFLDDNTPIAVSGDLPTTVPNAQDLNFSLSDVQKALSTPGTIIGGVHVFTRIKGDGEINIYTDVKGMVTSYTTTTSCE